MRNLSDKETILRIKNGKIDDFTYIVKKYNKQIYNYIIKKIKNRDDIEDVIQTSFLQFYKAIARFDEEKPVLPYLFQIVKNEMKMFWRSKKKTVPLDERIAVDEQEEPVDQGFIERQLSKLNHEQKKAIKLVSEGFSYREIGKFLGRPINTIRTIIRRAREKLKNDPSGKSQGHSG
ncbi:hypothetical protein A2774_00060 [Candidatus Roizmanbacteria bacterium RIFCSPHIGHO2_01_FULL_39_12c]|uniref:HTH luxR-type domain-containing protein n=1 Tax=Candidatus Roizmanbacteria bacterium RIFCSPHIGHO2_01_FULL_39_12c TaxID=1802031 RepID=A0A1F7GCL0_9BACT|nr:MAG: hypothetical protein A2774_00060 [Candidatus Roizmanbacteria bacterium RIFCSPHIGHO2_01_FULL_39_12c]